MPMHASISFTEESADSCDPGPPDLAAVAEGTSAVGSAATSVPGGVGVKISWVSSQGDKDKQRK